MYQPALWHDYFVVVGGGAAALTGLVFVAMTLHLEEVTSDPVHRHRARTILTGLTAVFIRCALVLMGGQNGQAIAVELIAVLVIVEATLQEHPAGRSQRRQRRFVADHWKLRLPRPRTDRRAHPVLRESGRSLPGRPRHDVVLHLHGDRRLAPASRCRDATSHQD
jgi:hypothetical protein